MGEGTTLKLEEQREEIARLRIRVAELEEAIRQACEELDKWGRFGQCSILVTREMLRQALASTKEDGDGR